MKKRIISLFCALLLLAPGFLLRTRSGRIQYYDYAAGLWHETGASMDAHPRAGGFLHLISLSHNFLLILHPAASKIGA